MNKHKKSKQTGALENILQRKRKQCTAWKTQKKDVSQKSSSQQNNINGKKIKIPT